MPEPRGRRPAGLGSELHAPAVAPPALAAPTPFASTTASIAPAQVPTTPAGPSPAAVAVRMPSGPQLVLAFDFGLRRIGAACGDTVSRTARPLTGIANTATGPRWDTIDALMRDWQPALIVIGMPYNVDGSESGMSTAVRGFAAEMSRRYAPPVGLIDERYSSLDAEARLRSERQAGQRKHRVARSDIDAAAACVILERWFTESRNAHADTTG